MNSKFITNKNKLFGFSIPQKLGKKLDKFFSKNDKLNILEKKYSTPSGLVIVHYTWGLYLKKDTKLEAILKTEVREDGPYLDNIYNFENGKFIHKQGPLIVRPGFEEEFKQTIKNFIKNFKFENLEKILLQNS